MAINNESLTGRIEKITSNLKLIGVTGSAASTTEAPLILIEGFERKVREEDIVLIKNLSGEYILAICRQGTGINENLNVGRYSPGIAYVRSTGHSPSTAKECFHFTLSFIGAITEKGIRPNDKIVSPGSPVYLFRGSEFNPLELLKPKDSVLGGFLVGEENWKIPFDKRFIPYHIGIFGATGSGKSFLARFLLIPMLKEAGYGALILDWAGVDYAPYFKSETISIMDIRKEPDSIIRYILEKTRNFGYRQETNVVSEALEEVVTEEWNDLLKNVSTPEELALKLREQIKARILQRGQVDKWVRLALLRLERGFQRLGSEDLKSFMGTMEIENLIPSPGEIKVIDMHGVGDEEKLAFFLTLSDCLLSKMYGKKELNLALIIDEAPQYCPHDPKGIQHAVTERIKDMCAVGRKHKLCMVLISQGIAGEIGINAAVRRNLNTQFIGQIHPLDLEEVTKRLTPYGIKPEKLLYLEPGQFYFIGKMNPSPTPLLISFKIAE